MKLPPEIEDAFAVYLDETAGQDHCWSMEELVEAVVTLIQSRERMAFNRARKAIMAEQNENVGGHLVEGLKFVHKDFADYQQSDDYNKEPSHES